MCLCLNKWVCLLKQLCRDSWTMLDRKQRQHLVSNRESKVKVQVTGYLLRSREGMVETGDISHYGFLIWTSSVHNVYKGKVMKTHTHRQDDGHVIIHKRTRVWRTNAQNKQYRLLKLQAANSDDKHRYKLNTNSNETQVRPMNHCTKRVTSHSPYTRIYFTVCI